MKKNVIVMAISHVGDFLIYGSAILAFLSVELGKGRAANVFGGNVSICLRMEIKMAPREFIEDGNIFDGDRAFPGVTLSSSNYEEKFKMFLFGRIGERTDESPKEEEQFALRSEFGGGGLMRIARFARRGAFYSFYESSRTAEAITGAIINPNDFEEIA